jgi:hypothetical protein
MFFLCFPAFSLFRGDAGIPCHSPPPIAKENSDMKEYRGLIVLGVAIVVLMVPFLIFVAAGWPGEHNTCMDERPNDGCFCEHYNRADVLRGVPGVRQPVNTWFNLYAIFTALLVACVVTYDRKTYGESTSKPNLISSNSWMPDLYIFAVLFLGLGSMWFHASLTAWGGTLDGMSMFVYASFLIFYSVRRLWNNALFFWLAYLGTIALNTAVHGHIDSLYLILLLVAGYLAVEITIWVKTGKPFGGSVATGILWWLAVGSIIAATVFWKLSQTGGSMCHPFSNFQPHGLLWHPLAGLMAVFLYFYWRLADEPVEVEPGLGEL